MARLATPLYTNNQLISTAWANAYWRDNEAAHWPFVAAGDMAQATAADVIARLPIGTAGQMLMPNAGETAFEWGGIGRAQIKNTNAVSIADTTYTVVTLDETDFDNGDFVDAPTLNKITIPSNFEGYYLIIWALAWDVNGTGYRRGYVDVNGAMSADTNLYVAGCPNIDTYMQSFSVVLLEEADVLTMDCIQNSGGALDLNYAFLGITFLGRAD